jgi:hypothetical protein
MQVDALPLHPPGRGEAHYKWVDHFFPSIKDAIESAKETHPDWDDKFLKKLLRNPRDMIDDNIKLFQDADFLIWLVVSMSNLKRNSWSNQIHFSDYQKELWPMLELIQPFVRSDRDRGYQVLAAMVLFINRTFVTNEYGADYQNSHPEVILAFMSTFPNAKQAKVLSRLPRDMRIVPILYGWLPPRKESCGINMHRGYHIHMFFQSLNIHEIVRMYKQNRDEYLVGIRREKHRKNLACWVAFFGGSGTSTVRGNDDEPRLVRARFLTGAHGLRPIRNRLVGYLVERKEYVPGIYSTPVDSFISGLR